MAESDLPEGTFELRAKKYHHRGKDETCGVVTISRWSKFIKDDKKMIIFSVLDDNSKLCWTFLVDKSLKKLRKSRKLKIKIPSSSVENLICVTAKLVVDVSAEAENGSIVVEHYRLLSQSSDNATMEKENDSLLQDLDIGQFFDVRPRLQSDVGVEDKDGSMLTFIEKNSLLPAERSRRFRTVESSVPFEIYQGNSGTAADNRHIRDLELFFISQALTRNCSLSLEVRDDGTLVGRARECEHPDNERSFRFAKAEVISSSEPFDGHSPQVDVDLSSNMLTLTVDQNNPDPVDLWKLIISSLSDPKETHVLLVRAEVPTQRIRITPGVILQDVRYTLIVKGLQDIDPEDNPSTKYKVVCNMKTWINNPQTEGGFKIDLVFETFNQVSVQIPRPLTNSIGRWEITVTKLTSSINFPFETTPKRTFGAAVKSGKLFRIPLSFQAGCTYKVELTGYPDVACTCKVKVKRKKSPACTCQMEGTEEFKGERIFRAEFTRSEVADLYEKTLDYIDREAHALCRWIYRNKPLEYFEEILANGGVMKTYVNYNAGDLASPINLKLKGLSFTASVRTGSMSGLPIPVSPFGNTRLHVPATELLEKAPNLYFSDFYCLGGQSHLHQVMLVLTRPGSEADRFCETRLPYLDISDNPFLFRDSFGDVQVSTSRNLLVHVLYTEDLEIDRQALKKNIKQVGIGIRSEGGVPKNRSCTTCNLDHALATNITQKRF